MVFGYVPWKKNTDYTDYLKLWLKFENNVVDSSPINRSITNNNVTFSNSIYKNDSYSGYFNNSTSTYLTMGHSNDFKLNGDFTIETWLYPIQFTGNTRTIASKWAGSSNWEWIFMCSSNIVTWGQNGGYYDSGTITTIPLNTWSHIALSKRGDIIRVFLNGVLESTINMTSINYHSSATWNVEIGRNGDNAWPFYGYLDDFKIYKGIGIY